MRLGGTCMASLVSKWQGHRVEEQFLPLLLGSQHGCSIIQVRTLAWTRGQQQQWSWEPHVALRPLTSSCGAGPLALVKHLRDLQFPRQAPAQTSPIILQPKTPLLLMQIVFSVSSPADKQRYQLGPKQRLSPLANLNPLYGWHSEKQTIVDFINPILERNAL